MSRAPAYHATRFAAVGPCPAAAITGIEPNLAGFRFRKTTVFCVKAAFATLSRPARCGGFPPLLFRPLRLNGQVCGVRFDATCNLPLFSCEPSSLCEGQGPLRRSSKCAASRSGRRAFRRPAAQPQPSVQWQLQTCQKDVVHGATFAIASEGTQKWALSHSNPQLSSLPLVRAFRPVATIRVNRRFMAPVRVQQGQPFWTATSSQVPPSAPLQTSFTVRKTHASAKARLTAHRGGSVSCQSGSAARAQRTTRYHENTAVGTPPARGVFVARTTYRQGTRHV